MQEQLSKKQLILNALAEAMKELRGDKSQFMFASENDISIAIISTGERGLKDPQLTTIFKLAEAYNLSPEKFIAKIVANLPSGFTFTDE